METVARHPDQLRRRLAWTVLLVGVAVWVGSGGALGPECALYRLTGLYCPGCGGTRAIRLMMHGDIIGSLRMNAMVFPGVMTCVLLIARNVLAGGTRHPFAFLADGRKFWGLVFCAVLFAVVRNLPVSPFTLLAPG